MPVVCEELHQSRPSTFNTTYRTERNYAIRGTADETEARVQLLIDSPGAVDTLPRQECEIERTGVEEWAGKVAYYRLDGYTFSTLGGQTQIFQALQTQSRNLAGGGDAPNYYGAIGVTRDSIEGVQIIQPQFNFQVTQQFEPAYVTDAYLAQLMNQTGTVNSVAWRGFAAGEALFLGAQGGRRGAERWEIQFQFAASPNRSGLIIPTPLGDIGPFSKDGWDYVWIKYVDRTDPTMNTLVRVPIAAYVERVYFRTPFAALGV